MVVELPAFLTIAGVTLEPLAAAEEAGSTVRRLLESHGIGVHLVRAKVDLLSRLVPSRLKP